MKYLAILFLVFLIVSCDKTSEFTKSEYKPSKIDSLKTNREIEHFIGEHDSLYRKFTLKKVQDIECNGCDTVLKNLANKLEVNYSWLKADLDNNGYTDLLVTGVNKTYTSDNTPTDLLVEYSREFNALVLMNFGADSVKLYDVTDGRYYGMVPKIEFIKKQPFLVVYKPAKRLYGSKVILAQQKRTVLTYMFNDFIEYNPVQSTHEIEKIEYDTNGCFGSCPVFSIVVENDGKVIYSAKEFNYSREWQKGDLMSGTYKKVLSTEELNEVLDKFTYLNFPKLQDNYNVTWTDDQTGTLKVTYDDGKVKTITDYGLQGTYGLRHIHKLFYDLRLSGGWEKVE